MRDLKRIIRIQGVLCFIFLIIFLVKTLPLEEWNEVKNHLKNQLEISIVIIRDTVLHTKRDKTEREFNAVSQSEYCLLTEMEREELKDSALSASNQVRHVYQQVEIVEGLFYESNVKEFTQKQCQEVVRLLGQAGFVSVTQDTNMENGEQLEAFYTAYLEKRDAMVTIFDVHMDGLIGSVTFLYRKGELQTYYVGIGWQEGGIPMIKDTAVSEIAEIKLTQKGYFIYTYKTAMLHSSLCQYWRIQPLSDKCRELTQKYIYGLSYMKYNILATNWDNNNVEDILVPCMFEDIYRIATGEILQVKNDRIPAKVYENIMTTYFPVSVEQLQKKCGYDRDSDSYQYERSYENPYPPFGEVVDYTENVDGSITLFVDGVWPDYNLDCAFTNEIVVMPFSDGTFRYLSNTIEQYIDL